MRTPAASGQWRALDGACGIVFLRTASLACIDPHLDAQFCEFLSGAGVAVVVGALVPGDGFAGVAEVFEQLGEQPASFAGTGLSALPQQGQGGVLVAAGECGAGLGVKGFFGIEKISDVADPLPFARVAIDAPGRPW